MCNELKATVLKDKRHEFISFRRDLLHNGYDYADE